MSCELLGINAKILALFFGTCFLISLIIINILINKLNKFVNQEKWRGERMSLSDKINKDINLLEKNDDLIKVKFVKRFIKWCETHSYMAEGVQVIDINKLKEGAGEGLI